MSLTDDPLAGYEPAFRPRDEDGVRRPRHQPPGPRRRKELLAALVGERVPSSGPGVPATQGVAVVEAENHPETLAPGIESIGAPELVEDLRHESGAVRWPWAAIAWTVTATVVGFGGFWLGRSASSVEDGVRTGTAVLSSHPAGATVLAGGQVVGITPVAVPLPPGVHEIEIHDPAGGSGVRRVSVDVGQHEASSHHVEFEAVPREAPRGGPAPARAGTGSVRVESNPLGASVLVDGSERGVTPLVLSGMSPGDHLLELRTETGSAEHRVMVEAGTTSTVIFSIPHVGDLPLAGWIVLPTEPALDVFESGRLVGSTMQGRVMVAAGRHDFVLIGRDGALRLEQTVDVSPGSHVAIRVDEPQ